MGIVQIPTCAFFMRSFQPIGILFRARLIAQHKLRRLDSHRVQVVRLEDGSRVAQQVVPSAGLSYLHSWAG